MGWMRCLGFLVRVRVTHVPPTRESGGWGGAIKERVCLGLWMPKEGGCSVKYDTTNQLVYSTHPLHFLIVLC